jgi:hypothetical protein
MTNARKKESKAISLSLVQAELFRKLAREQRALATEILRVIGQLRQANAHLMQVNKFLSRDACKAKAKIIPFPPPPRVSRVPRRPS